MPTTERTYKELTKVIELANNVNLATVTLNENNVRAALSALFAIQYVTVQKLIDEIGGPGHHDGIDLAMDALEAILTPFPDSNP